jgi:hypothetical protein
MKKMKNKRYGGGAERRARMPSVKDMILHQSRVQAQVRDLIPANNTVCKVGAGVSQLSFQMSVR